ncbi:hypothetical protein TNCV_57511 [Trichonephila clavipes]|nr:hypothetical protein TNCV_57511 [Trichonephila clavipes]
MPPYWIPFQQQAALDIRGYDSRYQTSSWTSFDMKKLFNVPLTNHNSAIQTIQDFTAETVCKKNSDSVATPPCHIRPTNQDTHSQAGPPTSGHIHYLDMGWRNASRSVSQ